MSSYTEIKGCVKMTKKKLTIIFSILLGTLLLVSAIFSASAYSDNDPLITLSYLQEVFAPSLKQEIASGGGQSMGSVGSSANATYKLLELNRGQSVMASSICEFIVRPGSKVNVISPFPTQGVADITNGVEVLSGQAVSINAYCLIPRGGDGRGITVVSDKA